MERNFLILLYSTNDFLLTTHSTRQLFSVTQNCIEVIASFYLLFTLVFFVIAVNYSISVIKMSFLIFKFLCLFILPSLE